MSVQGPQINTAATRTSSAGGEPGVPVITWLIGGVALVIALTAGALALSAQTADSSEPLLAEALPEEQAPPEDPVSTASHKNPLEITASFLDAQERGRLWNPSAMLSGIELVVKDGAPTGPIVFEFGEAIGRSLPGTPLAAQRHAISYEDGKVEAATTDSPVRRVALPEPNCPLEVAFATLVRSGVNASGRVGVLYLQSQKHARPVWLMTNEAGEATSLSAENCALLRR